MKKLEKGQMKEDSPEAKEFYDEFMETTKQEMTELIK